MALDAVRIAARSSRPTTRANALALAFAVVATGLRIASAPTANVSYLLVAAYALGGKVQAVQALLLSWLFSMLNPGIAADATFAALGRYAVLLCATMSVLLRSGALRGEIRASRPVWGALSIGSLITIHSLLFSSVAEVSVLKAISWTLAAATILSAWTGVSSTERETLSRSLFGGLAIIMLAGIPLLGSPIGFLRNGTGFQGLLGHPQALGSAMAILGAWAGSQALAVRRPPWVLVGTLGFCVALVVLSEARTAGISMTWALVLGAVGISFLSRTPFKKLLPGLRSPRIYLVLGVGVLSAVAAGPMLAGWVEQFLTKRSASSDISEAYWESRGGLIEQMYANIARDPVIGIGFGVASVPEDLVVERDPWLGLPTSAAVEKGVLPLAVVEELGIPMASLVGVWLWSLLARAARSGGFSAFAVLLCVLLMNFGESVLFSPGGMGLLSLIVIGWAVSAGTSRRDMR